jgi:hypothetical protein
MRPAASNLNGHQGVKKRPRPFLTEALSCRTGKSLTMSEVSRLHHYGFQIINAGSLTPPPPRPNIARRDKKPAPILAITTANCEPNPQSPPTKEVGPTGIRPARHRRTTQSPAHNSSPYSCVQWVTGAIADTGGGRVNVTGKFKTASPFRASTQAI